MSTTVDGTQVSGEMPTERVDPREALEAASLLAAVEDAQASSPGPGPGPGPVEVKENSGTYVRPPSLLYLGSGTLRLDIDGRYPGMTASGKRSPSLMSSVEWVANLEAAGDALHWAGPIWHKDGTANFPYTSVDIKVTRNSYGPTSATVTFKGEGLLDLASSYKYQSKYFGDMAFEFDSAAGTAAVTTMFTSAHPDRPGNLPLEILNLKLVFQRAGFDVKKSGGDNVVPLSSAGGDGDPLWSELELHDAMQAYWSHFSPKAKWSAWALFASLHQAEETWYLDLDDPEDLGGIMFDIEDTHQRQGCAIFEDSFIADAPTGDPAPIAWVRRMRFWTAAHEIGHTFNLAHSWQKANGTPWIPQPNEPDAASFMNYPYLYPSGPGSSNDGSLFFEDFEYRFSDAELLFMRHAPRRFVQQGNAAWADEHGFEEARVRPGSPLALELRVNRPRPVYDFMEPVIVECKLTNRSAEPVLVPAAILAVKDHMTVIVRKQGRPARQVHPYARYCVRERSRVLQPGESMYAPLFVGSGVNGWEVAEPGDYLVQVAIGLPHEDVVSNALKVRVTPSRSYEEQAIAQEFFSDAVGRILAFNGSSVLTAGNDALEEVAERLPESRAAVHARIALGSPLAIDRKRLELRGTSGRSAAPAHTAGTLVTVPSNMASAQRYLSGALADPVAAETLGHIGYHRHARRVATSLVEHGEPERAERLLRQTYEVLRGRAVPQRFIEDLGPQSGQ